MEAARLQLLARTQREEKWRRLFRTNDLTAVPEASAARSGVWRAAKRDRPAACAPQNENSPPVSIAQKKREGETETTTDHHIHSDAYA